MATSVLDRNRNVLIRDVESEEKLSICLVGGIYDKDQEYQRKFTMVPETLLEDALRARGHHVMTQGHRGRMDSRNVDIIHVHHLGIAAVAAAGDASTAALVYTSHDGAAMAGISEGMSRSLANRFIMSRADGIVALSQAEKEFQQRNYSLQGAIHSIIPNGINTENYHYLRKNRAGQGQRWQILFVGQLLEIKGVDRIIGALALLPRNVDLMLVYHCDILRGRLELLARRLGLQNRVHFLGSRTPDELTALYQHTDLFVLPSLGESLPSVVTEAMLCGTPIVASDVGGIRDQLGGYGILVPSRNTEALALAIGNVLTHYEEFQKRGEAMSQYAMRRFSIGTMVESHLELYNSLLKGRKSERKAIRRRNQNYKRPMNIIAKLGMRVLCKT